MRGLFLTVLLGGMIALTGLTASPALAKGGGGKGGAGGGGGGGGGGGQSTDVQAPTPPSPIEIARAKVAAIEKTLATAFEASDDFKAAQAKVVAAQAAYDAVIKQVMADLANTPDYQAAVDSRKAAADAVDAGRDSSTDDQIAALAQAAMKARTAVSKMEQAALAASAPAKAAKADLTAAIAAVKNMRTAFTASLKDNADWAAAKKDLDNLVASAAPAN
jgi:hypothetical protein